MFLSQRHVPHEPLSIESEKPNVYLSLCNCYHPLILEPWPDSPESKLHACAHSSTASRAPRPKSPVPIEFADAAPVKIGPAGVDWLCVVVDGVGVVYVVVVLWVPVPVPV